MLPTFLIIGAQKAATTTLHQLLRQHPEVFLPELKETNYLIEQGNLARGREWYESLFDPAGDRPHRGEASPGYTMFPHFRGAPERAATLMPTARLIYVIRHPVERMRSAWAQQTGEGLEDRDLVDALLGDSHHIQLSSYGLQTAQWLAHFPREQLLVLRQEDLRDHPGTVIDQVLQHLGLPTGWRPADLGRAWNVTEDKRLQRRTLRTVAGMARRSGHELAARRLGPTGPLGRLARPFRPDDLLLPADLHAALTEVFRSDLALLRSLVGPELDLWDLA